MPSQIKKEAIDTILATVRDNPGIVSAKVIRLIPIASSNVQVFWRDDNNQNQQANNQAMNRPVNNSVPEFDDSSDVPF